MLPNKIKIIFSLILVTIAWSSCEDFVDVLPEQENSENFFNSEEDYQNALIGAYDLLQSTYLNVMLGEIASDNTLAGGESANDVLGIQQVDDMTHTPVNVTLTELWQAAYEGINRANYLHQYKEKNPAGNAVTFAGKDALYGEVNFLRAYYYFHLVKFFGDVPLFTEKRLSLSESATLQRSPKADVYAQIERDLNAAITALPAIQVQKGRITKYAAQALLGKVLLYQKKYDAAAPILESIITSNAFRLVDDFGAMFLESGENGPESVFEIQYTNTSPYYNWGAVTRGQGNYAIQQCGIRGLNGSAAMPYAAGWSTNLPTQDLANAYAAGDQRKSVTVLDIEAYKNANPSFGITYQVAPYKNTGLYNQKYLPRKGQTSGQIELNYLNNFRIIRYADVLLMAAEAFNKAIANGEIGYVVLDVDTILEKISATGMKSLTKAELDFLNSFSK